MNFFAKREQIDTVLRIFCANICSERGWDKRTGGDNRSIVG